MNKDLRDYVENYIEELREEVEMTGELDIDNTVETILNDYAQENRLSYSEVKKYYGDVSNIICNEFKEFLGESKKLKTEAIYLVTPDEKNNEINLDEIMDVVNNITDTVKDNDATDVAQDVATEKVTDKNDLSDREMEVVDVANITEDPIEVVDEYATAEETPVEIIDVMDVEEPDATDMIMDTASVPGNGITSDIQADEMEPVPAVENTNGPMFVLAEQLISAFHTISSLHRNLKGGAWFDNHEKLDDYARYTLMAIDEIIEQNIALGGREPGVKEAIDAFPTVEIVGRNKDESYRIVRDLFNAIIALCEECKSELPGDVISKVEEFENYFRKEAEYKIAKTVLGEAKLMTKKEMKQERILEGKLSQVKVDALKDALETGDDQYIYQDGEEVYYTDESPKKNPKLFDRVRLLGTFITDMKDGKMVANYVQENFEKKNEYVSTSKFKKRLSEEKIGETELPDTVDYVAPEYNPELQEIAGDKISFEEYKKQFKDEIDNSYRNTYGDEVDKDLYNALADYMYNDAITGNVQTKKEYVDTVDEVDANKELVNDAKNESLFRGDVEVDTIDYEISHGSKPSNNEQGQWFFTTYKGDIKDYDSKEVISTPALKFKDAADYAIKEFKKRGLNPYRIYVKG